MRPWKQAILTGYYYGSLPARRVRNRRLAACGRAPILVAAYHRIADDRANGWTTSWDAFRRGILWLKRHFDLLSLAGTQQRVRGARNERPAVAITFDDGYEVNCRRALPFLLEQQVPFTYFVSTAPVLEGTCFEHDLRTGNRFAANTPQQLRELAAHPLVEIGAHSRTHADLGRTADPAALFDEVVQARDELEQALGIEITRFAFPFGQHANLNRAAFALGRAHRLECMVSAYGGYNFPGDDSFHLQRMCCDGPLVKLKNFATLDPYKQFRTVRYDYRMPGEQAPCEEASPT